MWANDSFLAKIGAKIKPHAENEKNRYPLFDLKVGQKRQVGVYVSCNTMGPWGAFDKIVDLLQIAKVNGWKLRYIFVVGCCGTSVKDKDKRKEECPRGTVLLARQVKDYLHTGKVKDGQVDGNPLYHDMGDEWLQELMDAREAADHRIKVEIVNYLTGPLVIKDDLFGKAYCEDNAKITGVEMEVVGVIKAVKAFHLFSTGCITGDPEQKVMLVKGVSDYTGKKGEDDDSCMLFGVETRPVDDDSLQVYATLQSLALVIRFVAGNIRRLF